MAILNKDAILAASDLKHETVEVPEWGGEVIVSEMTGEDSDAWSDESYSLSEDGKSVKVNRANFKARLVAACVVDEEGNRMFTTEDVAALGRKSAKALARLFEAADRLNGITPRSREALEKN